MLKTTLDYHYHYHYHYHCHCHGRYRYRYRCRCPLPTTHYSLPTITTITASKYPRLCLESTSVGSYSLLLDLRNSIYGHMLECAWDMPRMLECALNLTLR